MIQTIQAPTKPVTKRKRIMLVQLPEGIEHAQVVRYDLATMPNLQCKYVNIETGQDELHFSMMFHDRLPLYFVASRSSKHIGFYYPIRQYADGSRSCRCLEWQDHHDCKDVIAVEEFLGEREDDLSAITTVVA